MSHYFKSWRRKIGVVPLVMGCLFAAGWVRSLNCEDAVVICCNSHQEYTLFSSSGLFGMTDSYERLPVQRQHWPMFDSSTKRLFAPAVFADTRLTWHWKRWGFGCVEYLGFRSNGCRFVHWFFPYWSVVIPLTLLSVWMLLSKPPTKSGVSIQDEDHE